jgi:hypothetical protein
MVASLTIIAAGVAGAGSLAVAATLPVHPPHTSTTVPAGELRAKLNALLQEHAYLAAGATNAALGGRQGEFQAAAGALDANSVDLSKAIGSVYGGGAEQAFLALWRKHIGFFVDYATGVATKDKPKQDKAVNDLVGYTQDFGAFLSSANPNLQKAAVADLVKTHVLTLKDVVDAQGMGDQKKAYMALRAAASHMMMIADPLASAIAKQFPEKFTNEASRIDRTASHRIRRTTQNNPENVA